MGRSGIATWLPCNNFWPGGNTKKGVLIHGTASNGVQTAYQLATSSRFNDGVSASVQYIVDKDIMPGESSMCYQIVDEDDVAWGNCCCSKGPCAANTLPLPGVGACHDPWIDASLGCGHNWNFGLIEIENIKYQSDNSDTLTVKQWDVLRQLVRDICLRNNIPMVKMTSYDFGGITGHYDIDPQNKARCPGTFDWNRFLWEINSDKLITVDQARQYAQAAGFTSWKINVIVAIAMAESGLRYWYSHVNADGTVDAGVLGYTLGFGGVNEGIAYSPAQAFAHAWIVSKQGTDFTFWSTYTSGAYRAFMPNPLYCDVSQFQGVIDWAAYKLWAEQWDGISRVAMRATKNMMDGSGLVKDTAFDANLSGAKSAGISEIMVYHNAAPNLSDPATEFAFFDSVVRGSVSPVMLDYEQGSPSSTVQGAGSLADWAYQWLILARNAGYQPDIYASLNYIQANLQDGRLASFPLILADWTFDPTKLPPAPAPWTSYWAMQFTDKGTGIPGIPATVDINVVIEGIPQGEITVGVPAGWTDTIVNGDPQLKNPTTPYIVRGGFRKIILNENWDAASVPLENEEGDIQPVEEHVTDPVKLASKGTKQVFRADMLVYYADLNWMGHGAIGDELLYVRTRRDKLASDLAAAQASLDAANSKISALEAQVAAGCAACPLPSGLQAAVNSSVASLQPFVK